MLALRLPKDIEDRLDALAKKTGRTKSFYAREAILEHLDDLEDLYYAEKQLRDGLDTISLDESLTDLGLSRDDLSETLLKD